MELLAEIQSLNLSSFSMLYYGLLAFPLLLFLSSARLTGGTMTWIRLIIGCGVAAAVYQAWLVNNPEFPIRIDTLLISALLFFLYLTAIIALFVGKRWRGGFISMLVLGGLGAGMAWQWKLSEVEAQRLAVVLEERDRMLWSAQFRDRETYDRQFGPFGAGANNLPVGHWLAGPGSHQTRLIVNANARAWLFHTCGSTECSYAMEGTVLTPTEDGAGWQGAFALPGGTPNPIRIAAGTGGVTVQFKETSTQFETGAPPIGESAPTQILTYLGAFANLECTGRFANLRQIWLWQDAEAVTAIGIFRTLTAGSRVDNLSPVPMGQGTRASDDAPNKWQFSWQAGSNLTWEATVDLSAAEPSIMVREGTAAVSRASLQAPGLVRDSYVELAPLTSMKDLKKWFESVLIGHSVGADIPAC